MWRARPMGIAQRSTKCRRASTSYFAIYPEYALVVSVMMNKGQENLDALAAEVNPLVELFIAEHVRRGLKDNSSELSQRTPGTARRHGSAGGKAL